MIERTIKTAPESEVKHQEPNHPSVLIIFDSHYAVEAYKDAHNEFASIATNSEHVEYKSNPGYTISDFSESNKYSDNFSNCEGELITVLTKSGRRFSLMTHQHRNTQPENGFLREIEAKIDNLLIEMGDEIVPSSFKIFTFGGIFSLNRTDGKVDQDTINSESNRLKLVDSVKTSLEGKVKGRYGVSLEINPLQLHPPRRDGISFGGSESRFAYGTQLNQFFAVFSRENTPVLNNPFPTSQTLEILRTLELTQ